MRRTAKNAAEWNTRFAHVLMKSPHERMTPGAEAVAAFKVDYPHLMKRVPATVSKKLPRGAEGYTTLTNIHERLGLDPTKPIKENLRKAIEATKDPNYSKAQAIWRKAKSKPSVVIGPGYIGDAAHRSTFVMAHEMRHAADSLRRTNKQNTIHSALNQVVPYNLRATEWRANIAGVKKVVKEFGMDAKAARKLKKEVYLGNALLGAKSIRNLGMAPAAVAAAIMYKRHMDKNRASA